MLAKLKSKIIKSSDKILIVFGLAFLIVLIFSQQIQFTSLDLGRHLANGRFVWSNPQLLHTNFYSYTKTNFPFINHHWFSGVVFYGLYFVGGFKLLSVFNIILALTTFFLAFRLARQRLGFYGVSFLSLPVILLLSERVAIRPEAFSYLFLLVVWSVIETTARTKNFRRFYWLAPLFLLWVNLHIYFIFGLALVGFKVAAEFLTALSGQKILFQQRLYSAWRRAWPWLKGFLLFTVASLFNPHTWRGLLYPFTILHDYGYQIVENKTVFYLSHLMINYNFIIFKILLVILVLSLIIGMLGRQRWNWWSFFLTVFFGGLGCFAFRNIALFGLASLVLISDSLANWSSWFRRTCFKWWKFLSAYQLFFKLALILLIVFLGIFLAVNFQSQQNFIHSPFGWGIADNSQASAQFFKNNKLSGPIFNNYDIGSALIFWLYPSEKVFVDNRPEAYGAAFFSQIYKPIQSDPAVWKQLSARYGFNTIYFGYSDGTPWAQQFVRYILTDPDWSLVYFDADSIILVNKKTANPRLLKKFSLDSVAFRQRWISLSDSTRNLRAQFNLASLAVLDGQPDLAGTLYRRLLFFHPNNRQALKSLADVYASYQDQADLETALTYYYRALASGDKLPGTYDQIAMIYWRLDNYSQAVVNWRLALKLNHKDASALDYLGQVRALQDTGKLPLSLSAN